MRSDGNMAPLFNWWGKQPPRGTPVVVKMENPNWSMVELEGPSEEELLITDPSGNPRDKGRGKNAKQLTWVLLLKAHRAAGCLASIAPALVGLASAVKRRVVSGRTDADSDNDNEIRGSRGKENPAFRSRFYSCIKLFLWFSVLLLCFEVAAYYRGWHFGAPYLQLDPLWVTSYGVKDVFSWLYSSWVFIRVAYLAPPLQLLANVCTVLFLIQSLDRLLLCIGCFWIRLMKIKPVPKDGAVDLEAGDKGYFPMVLVQIPMCNEREVKMKFTTCSVCMC